MNINFVLLYVIDDVKSAGQTGANAVKKREAVYDRGEQMKNTATYVPKVCFLFFVCIRHFKYVL